ncbi:hypothetical protein AUEXF2481DRAFT_29034 [Aureobasidium subglaciale EXF-2481]|uniref:Uncharacterized protein n=1 Tax=Aureobasidium subglaciale (strain EXF-2481) TaxID=1043005 RepID=A0A074YHQ3_AURSE|nr:uncharacterized protein AUEXF2481DRAFT_29034 [Aureobasidium subglaciale EXF-2481]KAI5195698.1 hypothetical protein E4T38_08882 [Aureobasidium subglaciale]KAI5214673.1 hypothetical protein E4T40_08872 [Aureobasidium subglaciale]KAI5217588.1 hypothetical protein E4T41_08749 [Aureobasidium subglaciale]KAI5255141.1 hypothetical protein E4T46_08816 [Aureobasidium subglaciale]KEQ95599.1 hypothetical protein AUEXF2481DRAFT_29034 [Aureobasidium subglaciale EXF-2481]
MAPLPRLKVLMMLSMLVDHWAYAEACRLDAEDLWYHCDHHPKEGYCKYVLAQFRASLDGLEEYQRNNRPEGDGTFGGKEEDIMETRVAEMTDEGVKSRVEEVRHVPLSILKLPMRPKSPVSKKKSHS